MSLGGSLSGISFAGLGSGIDTQSIVKQLMQIESIPLRRIQARKQEIQARSLLYSGLRERVQGLRTATSALEISSVYGKVKASLSDASVASVSVSGTPSATSFELAVSKLASSEKLRSGALASADQPLGTSGTFLVNGRMVTVETTDTLQQIAGKISAAGGGVSATVVNGGPGQAYLSVAGSATGAGARMSFAAVSGTALEDLGLFGGALAARDLVGGNLARGVAFASKGATLQSLTGSAGAGDLMIGGTAVAVDFAADSLQTLADKINAAGAGATAQVVEVTSGSTKTYRLEVSGAEVPAGLSDPDGLWQQLGVLQAAPTNLRQAAGDAEFTVDGIAQRSATNLVSGVIEGVTLTLLSGDEAQPKTTTVTLARDPAAVVEAVKKYRDAYNALADFISQNSKFDKETFATGPLFADSIARQVSNTIFETFSLAATGVGLGNLGALGFTLDSEGKLQLDEAALAGALERDPEAVRKTMTVSGSASGAGLTFLGATAKSRANASGFVVHVTQAATQASMVANEANAAPWAANETLSFSGAVFGGQVDVVLSAGMTLEQVVDQLNRDSRLQGKVVASIEAGKLRLDSSRYGTPGSFAVVSDLDAGSDNSGIGTTGGVYTEGLDVAGTINGEAATGRGQVLSGNKGNLSTDGVQAIYTGTATGDVGTLSFTVGWAPRALDRMLSLTDSANGLMAAADALLRTQEEDADKTIKSLEERLAIREATLRRKFLAMEQAMSAMQQQMLQIQAATQPR
jgi:flagellar hook-associated protein 2